MPRLSHGTLVRLDAFEAAGAALATHNPAMRRAFAAAPGMDLQAFDYLFPQLQADDANLLPVSPQTVEHLRNLGIAMGDPGDSPSDPGDSAIPAAYTYFGQFLDHDITLEGGSSPAVDLFRPDLAPLAREVVPATIRNVRSATLDLDCVYGPPAPRDGDRMVLGTVTRLNGQQEPMRRPAGKPDDGHDLPREGRSADPAHDRAALIGDFRNDENTIVSQLHTAFLRAHNAIVSTGKSFEQARRLLRQHYQHIVIHDFLKRVADPAIVDGILENGNQVFDPTNRDLFMPLEFSFAAYRFGHSMARSAYNFNLNFNFSGQPGTFPASFDLLFTFSALSGQLGDFETLPDNWIAEWERLVDAGGQFDTTRRIDTKLAEPLFGLRNELGLPLARPDLPHLGHLAVRNLLRAYLVRMPTGQAVAGALGQSPLTAAELEAAAGSQQQIASLNAGGFLQRTPLWYYVLAEAAARADGQHLGPVGSTIVAEVLIGLVRRSADSILRGQRRWKPSLPSAQRDLFTLTDLLRLAGVLT